MKAQIVSFHCVLKNKLGQVLSSSYNKDVINQLEEGKPNGGSVKLRGLVAGIQNVRAGEHRLFNVPANEAYGPYNPKLVMTIPRSELPGGSRLVIGSEVEVGPRRRETDQVFRVIGIDCDALILDGNHPLAGHDLTFEIEVISAREACSDDFEDPVVAATSHYIH